MRRIEWILVLALAAVVGIIFVANAQQEEPDLPNARPVWENAKGSAITARLPGRMVRQGTARFNEAHDLAIHRARNGPNITEIAPETDPASQLKADLLEIIFASLNNLIDALALLLGLPPPDQGDSQEHSVLSFVQDSLRPVGNRVFAGTTMNQIQRL